MPVSASDLSDGVVLLRHPRASDEREYLGLRRDSRGFLEPWEPFAANAMGEPDPSIDCFSEDWFARYLSSANSERTRRFLVCRVDDGAIVGQCSFGEIIRGPLQQAFLGYWVGRAFARRGYMSRALRLALSHAFEGLRLHRVEANIQPQNAASIALANRVGFRKEGFSPRYLQIQGVWADHERWAMTAEEYRGKRGENGEKKM